MPTYYNGKEITSTSKLSGLSLIGRDSVNIGGKITILSTPPPPPREMRVFGDPGSGGTAGFAHPGFACTVGPTGYEIIAFILYEGKDIQLFRDKFFSDPLGDGFYWTDDTSQIGGDFGSFFISIQGGNGAIFGRPGDCGA